VETPVLVAGQTRDLTLDGVAYTVRALSFGAHARLQAQAAAWPAPSTALIDDALAAAAEEGGRPDLAEAIRGLAEADDLRRDFWASCPPHLDDEGRKVWLAENAAELRRIDREISAQVRKRGLALEKFGNAPGIAELRDRAATAVKGMTTRMVAAGIAGISGQPVDLTPAEVEALPSGHVAALAQAIGELLTPGTDAAKN